MQKRYFIFDKKEIFIFIFLMFILFVRADVVSINSGGSEEILINSGEYIEGFFSGVNTAPSVSEVVLNSSFRTNYTTENLTVYYSASDDDADSLTNITDWRINGNSITVLNMPFDTQIVTTATDAVRDYSTYKNNGTLGGGTVGYVPTWASDGKVGGAYEFDGKDDYISIQGDQSLAQSQLSISVWINASDFVQWRGLIYISEVWNTDYLIVRNDGEGLQLLIEDDNAVKVDLATSALEVNTWLHLVFVQDGNGWKFYKDGESSAISGTGSDSSYCTDFLTINNIEIGRSGWEENFFNGTIDEVMIFNRSLSQEQITEIYNAGFANHSVEMIVSNETTKGENWSVAVTPNDATSDGTTVLSNNLTIRNSLPVTTLISPENNNYTTDRKPSFNWSETDADGDSLTYDFKIIAGGSSCVCSDSREPEIAGVGYTNYTITDFLKCLSDNGCYYNWSVRAHDGDAYGPYALDYKLNITSLIDVTLLNDTIEFGQLGMSDTKNTTTNDPHPFVIQNDGNCMNNVTINASALFNTEATSSDYYKFKIDNLTSENNSFGSSTQVTWAQMPIGDSPVIAISELNWSNATDTAEVDLLVTIPPEEGASSERNSLVVLTAMLGE